MKYEVTNLDTFEQEGIFASLYDARRVARKLPSYEIWKGDMDLDGEFVGERRMEHCEHYHGDDDRVKQAIGQWSPSELIR